VDVYNGGSTPGLATTVSRALVGLGYKQGAVTDATAQSQAVTAGTQVFYGTGASANAGRIAKYFGVHAAALLSLPARHVEVLLGTGTSTVPAGLAPAHSTAPTGTSYTTPTPAYQASTPTPTCAYDQSDGQYDDCGTATPKATPTCAYDQSDGQYDDCNGNALSTNVQTVTGARLDNSLQ
jgi:hypothetical protein